MINYKSPIFYQNTPLINKSKLEIIYENPWGILRIKSPPVEGGFICMQMKMDIFRDFWNFSSLIFAGF